MRKLFIFIFIAQFVACSTTKDLKNTDTHLISDGTVFNRKSFYPNFSWEVTPQYLMFGDGGRVLNNSEEKNC